MKFKANIEVEIEANTLEHAIIRMKNNNFFKEDHIIYGYPEIEDNCVTEQTMNSKLISIVNKG